MFLGLTASRIVQEALTNVVRHAGASSVHVSIAQSSDGVTIDVSDDGAGTATSSPGSGLGLDAGAGRAGRPRPVGWLDRARRPAAGGLVSIRGVLADDQSLIREGFRSILERAGALLSVGDQPPGRGCPEGPAASGSAMRRRRRRRRRSSSAGCSMSAVRRRRSGSTAMESPAAPRKSGFGANSLGRCEIAAILVRVLHPVLFPRCSGHCQNRSFGYER